MVELSFAAVFNVFREGWTYYLPLIWPSLQGRRFNIFGHFGRVRFRYTFGIYVGDTISRGHIEALLVLVRAYLLRSLWLPENPRRVKKPLANLFQKIGIIIGGRFGRFSR